MLYRKIRPALIFGAPVLPAAPAFAQAAGEAPALSATPAQPPGGPGTAPQLEDIVVTAQRREQSLQRVPISVDAFDSQALEALSAESLGDLDRHQQAGRQGRGVRHAAGRQLRQGPRRRDRQCAADLQPVPARRRGVRSPRRLSARRRKLRDLYTPRNIINARVGWRSPGDHFSASLYVENLLNERKPRTLNTITADTFHTPYVRIDRPRFFGVELGYRY